TSFSRDWSSDVCSSDLRPGGPSSSRRPPYSAELRHAGPGGVGSGCDPTQLPLLDRGGDVPPIPGEHPPGGEPPGAGGGGAPTVRSEERRVGKAGGARGA